MSMRKKRALILAGAGASIDFGAPSTAKLTSNVEARVLADKWMRNCGGDRAYREIHESLKGYLHDGRCAVNFEHIYHCAHELLFTFEPSVGAVNEYRPLLVPFIQRQFSAVEDELRALVERMAKFIFEELSSVCDRPTRSLAPLAAFVAKIRKDHVIRIYTTNYDDFLLQAAPDLHTGFERTRSANPKPFDARLFWQAIDDDCVFHLHGSVHLGFPLPPSRDADIGALYWFDDRDTALKHSSFSGSGEPRMDGSTVMRAAVITGLDKLSRMQQQPFSHYYASMARDALTADIIYVIGSGLTDLHINAWLRDARRVKPRPPIVFVDYWRSGFLRETAYKWDRKPMEMLHELRIMINARHYGGDKFGSGWTLAEDRSSAIWDKGFLAFLAALDELDCVLGELK